MNPLENPDRDRHVVVYRRVALPRPNGSDDAPGAVSLAAQREVIRLEANRLGHTVENDEEEVR